MNIFTYWDGPKPALIDMLEWRMRELCHIFGYALHTTSKENIEDYISVPENFSKLRVQHRSDVARVKLINKYGGIWMDHDTLVMRDLSEYFKKIHTNNGFFLKNEKETVTNAVFGSQGQTDFMQEWESFVDSRVAKGANIPYEALGNTYLTKAYEEGKLLHYSVSDCTQKEAPIRKGNLKKYLEPDKELKKKILASKTPFLILQNPVCQGYEKLSEEQRKSSLIFELVW